MSIASDNVARERSQRVTALQLTGTPTKLTIGGSSTRVAIPSGAVAVRLASTGTCWIKFGTSSVVATTNDSLFPAGAEVLLVPAGSTHIACIADGASTGSLSITGMAP